MSRLVAVLMALFMALPSVDAATKKSSTPSRKSSATKPESPGIARPFAVPDKDDPNVFPSINAPAVILCDAVTGRVLYEKNADDVRAVASTQKLLTALRQLLFQEALLSEEERGAFDSTAADEILDLYAGVSAFRYLKTSTFSRLVRWCKCFSIVENQQF